MFSTSASMGNNIKKRLFIGLLAFSMVFLFMVLFAAWWIVSRQGMLINQLILTVVTALIILVFALLGVGLVALVWSIWRSKTIPSLQSSMYTATNMLYPVALQLGKWLGVDEEKIKRSYILVSNQLVKTRVAGHALEHIVILAPHCLQWIDCPHKITIDVKNCKGCKRCPVSSLLDLSRNRGVELVVATGGTSARKILKEKRPEGVVAIACERDLTSGIQDIGGLPVIGVVNERPEGPCCNTRVDLCKVEDAIRMLQEKILEEKVNIRRS